MASRCTDCGECSRVCPQHIPLHLLNRKFIKDINELYGEYQAGADFDSRPPLMNFTKDDCEPSVVYERGGANRHEKTRTFCPERLVRGDQRRTEALYIPADDAAGQASFTRWQAGMALSKKLNTVRSAKDLFFPQVENLMGFRVSGEADRADRDARRDCAVRPVRRPRV